MVTSVVRGRHNRLNLQVRSFKRSAMNTLAVAENPLMSRSRQPAHAGKAAPFLPMSRAEMDALGWDACDIVLVTGDAYVDHPSFGMAIIGRLLEAQGFRVGIIAQPDWQSAEPFAALGRPTLFFGVTGGNMDFDGQPLHGRPAAAPQRQLHARRRGRQAARPLGHRLCAALPRGVPRRADRARRHRELAAPHRPLRLLVRQGAPLDPGRRQGGYPALRQCRARGGRGRAPARRRRAAIASLDDIRGVALFKSARARQGWTEAARRRSRRRRRRRPHRRRQDRHPHAGLRAGRSRTARPMRAPPACCTGRAIPAMRAPWCSATATASCG